jgi:hypothetical protein
MNKFNIVALFCQDIREEKDDVISLIGILPDNLLTPKMTPDTVGIVRSSVRVLSSLHIYLRINFDPDFELPEALMRIVLPDDQIIEVGKISADVIAQSRSQAKEAGLPLAGVLSRLGIGGFAMPKPGILKLEVVLGEQVHLAGALNFKLVEENAISPNASQQPS